MAELNRQRQKGSETGVYLWQYEHAAIELKRTIREAAAAPNGIWRSDKVAEQVFYDAPKWKR